MVSTTTTTISPAAHAGQTPWINVLSDAGIEINASCVSTVYFGMDSLQTVTILIGSACHFDLCAVAAGVGPGRDDNLRSDDGLVRSGDGRQRHLSCGQGHAHPPEPVDPASDRLSVTQYVSDTTNFYFVDNAIYINYGALPDHAVVPEQRHG